MKQASKKASKGTAKKRRWPRGGYSFDANAAVVHFTRMLTTANLRDSMKELQAKFLIVGRVLAGHASNYNYAAAVQDQGGTGQ